ncbi:MAG: DUF3373 family protein [Campylobacterota bacterium]|nr:DUF3373 family protein [Campylobacterota bacterium]
MKKIIALSTAAFLTTATYANTEMQAQIDELTAKIAKMEKKQKSNTKNISKVNKLANKDNIKFDVDFRTSYDNISYETAGGNKETNSGLFSNRLWLGMGYAPTSTMLFKGQLSVNKAFGASGFTATGMPQRGFGFDSFDWIVNETLTDNSIKLREAYWLWMPTIGGFQTTWSVGRRPATNGFLGNLREDDKNAKSPLAHVINMEFDGASASIGLDDYVPGMNFKICIGRGLTNAQGWANNTGMNYIEDENTLDTSDMLGFIFVPYDDGQYSVKANWYRGFSIPGMTMNMTMDPADDYMITQGDMDGAAISVLADGVGDEINDFLDETKVFASWATTTSRPDNNKAMLGSMDEKTGYSYWIGTQMPNLTGGKFGLEYNHGSKYWRPFTYGEDTMIGSKMAVRGSAYEAYWSQPLVQKGSTDVFSMQIRYTYLDYDFSGSNAFFGDYGTPVDIDSAQAAMMGAVKTASDLRVYFRYRY